MLRTVLAPLALSLPLLACQGPHLRSKAVDTKTYESTIRCSQGPIEAHFVAQGAKWGEGIEIRACGPRGVQAQARVEVEGSFVSSGAIGWSDDFHDNSRCVLRDVEASSAVDGQSSSGSSSTPGEVASAGTASKAPSNQVSVFRDTGFPGLVCPEGDVTVFKLGPVRKGAAIHVKVWSDQPNDFESALVQIRQRVYWPSVSESEWEKHVAKREARRQRREAKRAPASEAEMRARIAEAEVYTGPNTPPPPARAEVPPPRVSRNAEWVPGYWHWAKQSWLWIAGDWRVPKSDIAQGYMLRAGYMPPALRDEAVPSAPSSAVVWTPGYWSWSNAGYIWIAGSWRLPPSSRAVWTRNRWRVSGGGAVFLPGGWSR